MNMLEKSVNYTQINADTIDQWVQGGWEWGRPILHEVFLQARQGKWGVLLTPTKAVPKSWFPKMAGCRVLGLASGGGQQMPVFAALGARCTVMDYSPRQLDSEKMVALREGYEIQIVRADMTKPFPFEDASFDLIFHPVSNCYIQDVTHVWRECFRVLAPGGMLLSGLDNGMNFALDENTGALAHRLPYNPLDDPNELERAVRAGEGVQFSHTIEEQIAGQLQAGFLLLDVYGDTNGSGILHEYGIPSFWATCAKKPRV